MLRYVAYGVRDFQKTPVLSCARLNWEFYAVTGGICAPVFPEKPDVPLQSKTLWLMPPRLAYGWRAGPQPVCRCCFHFPIIPKEIQEYLGNRNYLSAKLSPADVRRLNSLAEKTLHQFKNPHSYSHLYYERVLLELCWILLKNNPDEKKAIPLTRLAEERTASAIAWYTTHMAQDPTVDEVASALHMTGTHLRRMTQNARGLTPRQIFREQQMKQSLEMLANGIDTLEEIAKKCGFKNASNFSKIFQREMGMTANTWRTRMHSKRPEFFLDDDLEEIAKKCGFKNASSFSKNFLREMGLKRHK